MKNYKEIIDAFKQDLSIENIGAVNNAIDEQKEFKPGEYKPEWIDFVSTIIDIALAHYERDEKGKYRKNLINLINNCLNNGKSFGTKTENNAGTLNSYFSWFIKIIINDVPLELDEYEFCYKKAYELNNHDREINAINELIIRKKDDKLCEDVLLFLASMENSGKKWQCSNRLFNSIEESNDYIFPTLKYSFQHPLKYKKIVKLYKYAKNESNFTVNK